ncbi:putative glucooligosaccharide oxidase, partial [Clathrospora elynae]
SQSVTQCIETALGDDSSLYAFPQDLMYQMTDVHAYNLDYSTTPAAVTYPKTPEQVSGVVMCAHANGVAVQARSGGHSYANYGLGGYNGSLVVDMKNFADFNYNAADQTVTFGPGNRLGDLSKKLKPLDRVMSYGVEADIGSGGHMTIGGLGPLGRQFGLAADQIVSAQCVLGNGTIVTASASMNPDLFFAIRGAAFSFAIVTEFTMQTAPAPVDITSYQYNITAGDVTAFTNTFQAWQKVVSQPGLSRLFSSTVTLTEGTLLIQGTFYGPQSDFDALNLNTIFPAADANVHVESTIIPTLFTELGDVLLDATGGISMHFYAKSVKTTNKTLMSVEATEAMFSYIKETDKGTPVWLVIWDLEGGAISDLSQTATAYWNRDALYFMQSYVVGLTGEVSATSKSFLEGLSRVVQQQTGADESAYPGYVDAELSNPQKSYWGYNMPRLQRIKAAADPDNVFRNPQTIPV